MLVGTKTFCLSEEQQMIDEHGDSSGYDPSYEEEGEMPDESRGQGNNTAEEQESTVGKQDNVGGEKGKKRNKSNIRLIISNFMLS